MLTKTLTPIPQNDKLFFLIKLGNWKNSIDVIIEEENEIFLNNLFLIFKSYLIDNSLGLIKINIISEEIHENKYKKIICFANINIDKLKKQSYSEFENWYESTYLEIWKYTNHRINYGFRFTFNSYNDDFANLNIYPTYPWNEKIIKLVTNSDKIWLDEISRLKKKIKKLEHTIKKIQPK